MWSQRKPIFGDHIRVNRGFYYHHGIYADDDHIIQFGSNAKELDPSLAEVMVTNLDNFLKGGILEVRDYTIEEQAKKRAPMDIVNYAFTQIGRKGYDLINNNCEHFANECVFGEAKSDQVDGVKDFIKSFMK